MPEPLKINMPPDDVYRIIEALDYYSKSWEATEICRRDGYMPDDAPIHVDCYDPKAAHREMLKTKGVLRRFHQELDRVGKSGKVVA